MNLLNRELYRFWTSPPWYISLIYLVNRSYSSDEMCNFYMMFYTLNKEEGYDVPSSCSSTTHSLDFPEGMLFLISQTLINPMKFCFDWFFVNPLWNIRTLPLRMGMDLFNRGYITLTILWIIVNLLIKSVKVMKRHACWKLQKPFSTPNQDKTIIDF